MNIMTARGITGRRLDGEGSVQVALDPTMKIGNAKVFAVYGAAASARRGAPPVCSR